MISLKNLSPHSAAQVAALQAQADGSAAALVAAEARAAELDARLAAAAEGGGDREGRLLAAERRAEALERAVAEGRGCEEELRDGLAHQQAVHEARLSFPSLLSLPVSVSFLSLCLSPSLPPSLCLSVCLSLHHPLSFSLPPTLPLCARVLVCPAGLPACLFPTRLSLSCSQYSPACPPTTPFHFSHTRGRAQALQKGVGHILSALSLFTHSFIAAAESSGFT
jgi:hypothetical protein